VSGQQHASAALYPRERPGTHFTEGWVGPRVGLDGNGTMYMYKIISERATCLSVRICNTVASNTVFVQHYPQYI